MQLTPAGWGISWEEADLDFDVSGLINGIFGTKAWMKKIAAKEGRSKSIKKQTASKMNGKKGGRQKK